MSHPDDDDARLDAATLRALRESGDLVPTTESEVEQAEASLPHELELPEALRSYRPRSVTGGNVQRLPERRRAVLGYAVTAALGALAAATALHLTKPPSVLPVTSAGGELVRPSASAHAQPVPLSFQSRCERECCAGSSCSAASETLRSCPSGIRCVACATDNVAGGPYRLRLGSVIATEAGQKLLPLDAPLELCVVGGSVETTCVPALGEPGGEAWRLLKVVTPLQDLLTGLTVQLRKRGDTAALARWKHVVSPTPDLLCKGLAIQLNDGTETLGRLSAFIEPTHFVELARAAAVPELLKKLSRFDVSGIEPRIYESSQTGAGRFALVLGPLDKIDADALRWQALDQGVDASINHGLDLLGSPRPAH